MLGTAPRAPWPGRGVTRGGGRHLFTGGFPLAVWVSSAVTRLIRPGYSVSIAIISPGVTMGHWDRESRYNDCLWSVSVPAPGPRELWHNRDIVTLSRVPCDVMWCQGGRPRHPWVTGPGRQTCTHWPAATGSPDELTHPLWPDHRRWCLTYDSLGTLELGIVSDTATIYTGIYWDLSKQRISKLYRFYISNNPSPRIRPFKSQSNLTSDHWPGSISLPLSPHPQLSWCLRVSLMSSWPIRLVNPQKTTWEVSRVRN